MNDVTMTEVTRRQFVQRMSAVAALAALSEWRLSAATASSADSTGAAPSPLVPWYRRSVRWGQTNLTEIDAKRFDLRWWRAQWRRTAIQGVVINAGGIVAYYPTTVPLHRRSEFLGDRDLFGELRRAAKEDGLAVYARMDSNRAGEDFYQAHPEWFAHDAAGQPYQVTNRYVACVNSPYYDDYIPAILREVAERYRPEGFTDNNWNGPMRHQPCFCAN